MLAARIVPDHETIKYKSTTMHIRDLRLPVFGTPKIDGIRAFAVSNQARSRAHLPIPNQHVQDLFSFLPDGLDGELVIPYADYNETQSAIMSNDGQPDFRFRVFDYCPDGLEPLPFVNRWRMAEQLSGLPSFVELLNQRLLSTIQELEEYETWALEKGHEGICVRNPTGFYKSGRSTTTEQYLLKIKRFHESEAEVIDVVELQHNTNAPGEDAFGLTKRPKFTAGMVPGAKLGALVVRDLLTGIEFEIGSGFTLSDRVNYWTDRNNLLGRIVTYKYQPYGVKERPRCPVFRGFRFDV